MPRHAVSFEEWWPVIVIEEDGWQGTVELSSEELAEYEAALKSWKKLQSILQDRLVKNA